MIGNSSGGAQARVLSVTADARFIRAAEYAVRFALSFVLAGSELFGAVSPLAAAMTAASGPGAAGGAAFLGAAAGYLAFCPFRTAIRYLCAAALVYAASVAFRAAETLRKSWFAPACAASAMVCVSFTGVIDADFSLRSLAVLTADTALAGGGAYFFKTALSPWSGRLDFDRGAELTHTVSVLVLLAGVLIAVSRVRVLGFISPGRGIALAAVMLLAYRGGAGAGCCFGVVLGLAMDAAAATTPFFCMAYGVSALAGGIVSRHGRLPFALVFIAAAACCAMAGRGGPGVPAILYEVFLASVAFIALPRSAVNRVGAMLPPGASGSGDALARRSTRRRVDMTSLAFTDLYDTVKLTTEEAAPIDETSALFDRATEQICRRCENMRACWDRDYAATKAVLNDLTPKLKKDGRLEPGDFPVRFSQNCPRLPALTAAINAEARALRYRRQFQSRIRDNRSVAFHQYSDIAAILSDISLELQRDSAMPEQEARLRRFLTSQGYHCQAAVYSDRRGRLRAEISGGDTARLLRDREHLEKLSAALKTRLCTRPSGCGRDTLSLMEAEPLAASVGISSLARRGGVPSGDRGAYFKTDDGILHILLSDGMGTGEAAARQSADAVRVLERFLRSGVAPETAVRILNDLLLLKNEDDTVCASVDLVTIDLFTGETHLFKYGAAPSYLKQGSRVRRVRGESLAAGLGLPPHDAPDHIRLTLQPGECAVLVSDGVTCGGDDSWLVALLEKSAADRPKELSRDVIRSAAARFGDEDDMSAYVVSVGKRK